MENMKNLKKDDFSDLMVNEVCLALVQSPICHWPYVVSNFLLLFVFKDSVYLHKNQFCDRASAWGGDAGCTGTAPGP